MVVAFTALDDAGSKYENFLLVMAYWIAPWLGVVLVEYVRRMRRGVPGSLGQVIGFFLFAICAVEEALVTAGVAYAIQSNSSAHRSQDWGAALSAAQAGINNEIEQKRFAFAKDSIKPQLAVQEAEVERLTSLYQLRGEELKAVYAAIGRETMRRIAALEPRPDGCPNPQPHLPARSRQVRARARPSLA